MKKLITVLLALGAMLSTSCKDDVDFEAAYTSPTTSSCSTAMN